MLRSIKILLIAGMLITGYFLILAWNKDYGQTAEKAQNSPVTEATAAVAPTTTVPGAPAPARMTTQTVPSATLPTAVSANTVPASTPLTPTAGVVQPAITPSGISADWIRVTTDIYTLWINPVGGDIVRLELRQHQKSTASDQPYVMLQQDSARHYVAESGLIGAAGASGVDTAAGRAHYQSVQRDYTLAAGQGTLTVPLTLTTPQGITIVKSYVLKAGQYPIALRYRIANHGQQPWSGQMYAQLVRDHSEDPGKSHQGIMGMATYLGGAWGTPDHPYNKLKLGDFSKEAIHQRAVHGWVGMVQHYFVSAWIPDPAHPATLVSRQAGDYNVIGFTGHPLVVPAGKQVETTATLYSGPKIQSLLKELAPGLNQTVDYGWLWPIAQVLFIGLKFIHGLVGNWGWSIIFLTVIVKMMLFPLSAKSYRSMAKMKLIGPEMQRLKEEYGEDRMKFSQEMMALYKREQVNPLSGCLPMLMQMPIFLALYWVLMESVELRHAPWMGWITDLSAMDHWFILPLIMGATMYAQQLLNPQPADPMQAKVLRMMPIIFTVFLLFFPAGLVLYWIVNNLLTIAQQYLIQREILKRSQLKAG